LHNVERISVNFPGQGLEEQTVDPLNELEAGYKDFYPGVLSLDASSSALKLLSMYEFAAPNNTDGDSTSVGRRFSAKRDKASLLSSIYHC